MIRSKQLLLTLITAVISLFEIFAFLPSIADAASIVERVYGKNRIETAVEISKYGWPEGADTVILARADNPSDALSSASLSSVSDAPILLTYTNDLPEIVLEEIDRLGASNVYILGGKGAISQNVEDALSQLPIEVTRITGATRFETAANINIEAGTALNTEAIIVNGFAVADSLSASSNSAINQIPIYLTNKTNLPVNLPSNIKKVTIYGGEGVVGKEVYDSLVKKGITVTRVSGKNRYLTNLNAADPELNENAIIVRGTSTSSTSEQYPDAVAGAGLAHKLGANIILSEPTITIPEVKEHFRATKYPYVLVLGGEGAVRSDVVFELTSQTDSTIEQEFDYNIVASAMDPIQPILYTLSGDDNSVRSYNYTTGESKTINLSERPEQLYIENNKIYITLVHQEHSDYWWDDEQSGGIAIVDIASFKLIKEFDINIDPFDIVVDNKGFIYIAGGSGQWTKLKSFSEVSGLEVSSTMIRQRSYLEMAPNKTKIYAIDTDVSPRDISQFAISNGQLSAEVDSPYHGEIDLGNFGILSNIKVSTDGQYLFNDMGHVFNADLTYQQELEVPYSDIAFDLNNNRFYTGISDIIFQHRYDDFGIDSYFVVNGEVIQLFKKDNQLFILSLQVDWETEEVGNYMLEVMDLPSVAQFSSNKNNKELLNKAIEEANKR